MFSQPRTPNQTPSSISRTPSSISSYSTETESYESDDYDYFRNLIIRLRLLQKSDFARILDYDYFRNLISLEYSITITSENYVALDSSITITSENYVALDYSITITSKKSSQPIWPSLSQSQWVSANNNNWVLGGIISSLLVIYHKLISISNTLFHTWSLDRVKRSYSLSLRGHLK